MAKLGTYYGLCPLIDHRSLLGISKDEEPGVVVVTLGKNIAIKYRLADQKQLHSWRTKEKFSSPIIYDQTQAKYVGVFNNSFIRMWSGNEEFLDKLKKFKFNQQIYSIILCNDRSFIVFKNGALYPLQEAVDKRKELNLDNKINVNSELIIEVLSVSLNEDVYIGLIVKSDKTFYLHCTKFDAGGQHNVCKVHLHRDNFILNGCVLHAAASYITFLSLWNDGRIYSLDLKDFDEEMKGIGEQFATAESISCKEYVSMVALDENYIAMYGCNSNEEGALLVIYNIQFKVIQSMQTFKLFTKEAKMWRLDENLLFPVGQHLAVTPFYLDTEQLAALVGSHKVIDINPDPEVAIVQICQVANWGADIDPRETEMPELLRTKISNFLDQGLPETTIFEMLLLKIGEEKDVETFTQAVNYFREIPEKCLAEVLKLALNFECHLFKENTECSLTGYPLSLQPLKRSELIDVIFTKSFNETLLLPYLRSALTLNEVLTLLKYVYFLLSEDGHLLPSCNSFESEAKLIDWSCALIDANYQKILLTRDNTIMEVISSLRDLIKEELSSFNDLKCVFSLVEEISRGKSIQKAVHVNNLTYSVEELSLY